ncbi:MAG: PIN domain-containing protein [Desulfurellaceae bacterium]|nr:PIN domain-containing protein [Desulfurellaceae bacterium]
MNYVLIDLENIQPEHLSVLAGQNFKVLVFVGQNQSKLSFDLVSAVQHLGKNAEYIKIQGNGPNALDFHIAFYIGQFSVENSDSHFYIISKDKGFDPLIKHLESKKIPVHRHKDISGIPLPKPAKAKKEPAHVSKPVSPSITKERVQKIVEFLIARGNAKPRKLKTLSNSINALFSKSLSENELDALVAELVKRGVVIVSSNKTNVSYKLKK